MTIGENIKYYRKRMGITQNQLAALTETHPVSIRKYETNKMQPQIDILKKLAGVFEISLDDLCSDSEPKEEIERKNLNKRIWKERMSGNITCNEQFIEKETMDFRAFINKFYYDSSQSISTIHHDKIREIELITILYKIILSCLFYLVEEERTIENFCKLTLWDNERIELFVEEILRKESGDEYCQYYMNEFKEKCSEDCYEEGKIKLLLLLYVIKFYNIDFPFEIFVKSPLFDSIGKNFSDINSRINFLEEEVGKLKEIIKKSEEAEDDGFNTEKAVAEFFEMGILSETETELEIEDDIPDDFIEQIKEATDNLVDKREFIFKEKITEQQVIACAKTLLENTDNYYLKNVLEELIINGDCMEEDDIYLVVKKICEDGFDITGFGLEEIPHSSVYTFSKKVKELGVYQEFDVYLDYFNGGSEEVTVGYVGDDSCTHNAKTIKEAIEKREEAKKMKNDINCRD